MRPTDGSVIYRPDLGETVIEAGQDPTGGFIGLRIMPPYTTPFDTGTFDVIPTEVLLKMEDVSRQDRGAYNRSGWSYEKGHYLTRDKGHEEPIDDNEFKRLETKRPGLADEIAVMRGMGIILRAQEARIASKVMDPGTFDVSDLSAPWDAPETAKPISEINAKKRIYRAKCGMLPNALILSWSSRENICQAEEVINRLKYTFPGIDLNNITDEQLARILKIPYVLVGNAMYDAADKNQAAEYTDIWSNDYAALTRISQSEDLTDPCIGRTFIWDSDSKADPIVEVYRENQIRSDVYRTRHHVDECLIRSFKDDGTIQSDISKLVTLLIGNLQTS